MGAQRMARPAADPGVEPRVLARRTLNKKPATHKMARVAPKPSLGGRVGVAAAAIYQTIQRR
jgi:hypothetical protein